MRAWIPRLPWWAGLMAFALAPVLALNLAVSFFGSSAVFPLSPFFLAEKASALAAYFAHRPFCLLSGHGDLSAEIRAAEARHRLPRGLLGALVKVESDARPHRISFAGAMGPAQLMPGTARLLGVEDPFDPRESIDGGARYLQRQLARYQDVRLALAAYNAGPGAVSSSVPRNGETEYYVARILAACGRCDLPRPARSSPRVATRPTPTLAAATSAQPQPRPRAPERGARARPQDRPGEHSHDRGRPPHRTPVPVASPAGRALSTRNGTAPALHE